MLKRCLGWMVAAWMLVASPAWAADVPANPSTYRSLIPTLQPGDRLLLAAGDYPDGLPVTDLVGTAAAPIVISGPESGDPAVFLGNPSRNTVSIRRSAYVVLRYLTLDGQSIDNVDAVKVEGDADNWAHHLTLEHLTIVNHDPNQQTVGISTKAPAWDFVIRYNVIHSAGTGLYLGNSDGSAPFVRGVIEHNLVVDPEGYCMEIKHQNPLPSGALQGAALDTALVAGDTDLGVDFNGTVRDHTWRGAYRGGDPENPGWDLGEEIKPEPGSTPEVDAGSPPVDAALPGDAGPSRDAGNPGADGATVPADDQGGGCGCTSSGTPMGGAALLWLLWLLWGGCRRRRRTRG